VKTVGIVLSAVPYSESSMIYKALCRDMGHISIIAKGIRKQDAGLCHLQEYELHLLEPKEEGLYLLKDFQEQRDYSIYPTAATWAAADCGAELQRPR